MKAQIVLLCCLFFIVDIPSGFGQESNASRPVSATITIKAMDEIKPDSMCLYVYTRSTELNEPDYEFAKTKNENGEYKFVIKGILQPVYISLYRERRGNTLPMFLLQNFLVEPGDDVLINMTEDKLREQGIGRRINDSYFSPYGSFAKNNTSAKHYYLANFSFSGTGAEKYTLRYMMDTTLFNNFSAFDKIFKGDILEYPSGKFKERSKYDTLRSILLGILDQKKDELSKAAYQIMKTDLIASLEYIQLDFELKFQIFTRAGTGDTSYLRNVTETYPLKLRKLNLNTAENAKAISFHYSKFLVKYLYYCSIKQLIDKPNMVNNINRIVDTINLKFKGEFRDRLLYLIIKTGYQTLMNDGEDVIAKAKSYMSTDYYIQRLNKVTDNFSKGRDGFDFDLPDADGKRVRFSNFKGKVVFVDFWFTGCTACAKYYKETVSHVEQAFRDNKDVVFVTIATDSKPDTWLKSVKSGIYTNDHVVNLYTEGKAYSHPVCQYYEILSAPRPILFGRDGKVFSCSYVQLRGNGVEGLTKQIEAALREGQ